ncbi:MAG: hypothetical protein KF832_02355 [Caldilineaceae bacterium]|nr:hypothetical protein [Caldilineaceae bacterium]
MEAKYSSKRSSIRNEATPEQAEEFMLLMSLALDNLADDDEATRLEGYLNSYPTLAAQWEEWQQLHHQFVALPHAEPAAGFVGRFEERLTQQERRQRLWFGAVIGSITLLLWLGVVAGLFSMGAYLFVNQGSWLSALLQNLTYAWASLMQWLETGWQTFGSFASTPQAKAIGAGYLLVAVAMLGGWLMFLRRSLHHQELSSQVGIA